MKLKNRAFQVSITMALAAFLVLPMPAHTSNLDHHIRVLRAKIQDHKRREGVLTTTITHFNNRISGLQGEIRQLQDRQNNIQESLSSKRAELFATQNKLEKARDRLARLKIYLGQAEKGPGGGLGGARKEGGA